MSKLPKVDKTKIDKGSVVGFSNIHFIILLFSLFILLIIIFKHF
jgi:hypothetical protein